MAKKVPSHIGFNPDTKNMSPFDPDVGQQGFRNIDGEHKRQSPEYHVQISFRKVFSQEGSGYKGEDYGKDRSCDSTEHIQDKKIFMGPVIGDEFSDHGATIPDESASCQSALSGQE